MLRLGWCGPRLARFFRGEGGQSIYHALKSELMEFLRRNHDLVSHIGVDKILDQLLMIPDPKIGVVPQHLQPILQPRQTEY